MKLKYLALVVASLLISSQVEARGVWYSGFGEVVTDSWGNPILTQYDESGYSGGGSGGGGSGGG